MFFQKKRLIYGEETSPFYEKEMKTFLLIRENNVFFYIFVFFFHKKSHLRGGKLSTQTRKWP